MLEMRSQRSEVRGRRLDGQKLGVENQVCQTARFSLYLLASVLCLLTLIPSPNAHAEGMKIGYVNVGEVFDGYERTKNFDSTLEKKGKQKEAELEGRMSELKKLRESLELLNDQARDVKAKEIEEKTDQLQQFRNASARDLRRERDAIAKEILKEIQKVIDEYAKANGFSVILDSRSLLYGQPAYDVTDEILKRLNTHPAAAAKPS